MSATVDVSDSLDEARTRLERTARALNGAWVAALCSMVALVVASLALLLVAMTIRPVYVVMWSVLLAASGFNVTRFWPRRRSRPGRLLSRDERAALRRQLDPEQRLAWPDVVRLVPRPELELAEGELVLGLPLLACLDVHELRQLLAVAAVESRIEEDRAVRWALRVAHGDVGRQLVGRRPRMTWATSRLTETLRTKAAALEADLGNWAGACERAASLGSAEAAAALTGRDQVADAWALVRQEWLEPAFARGRRHVAPFTGLRHFVEGAEAAGWLSDPRPWWSPVGVLADLVATHEEAVALELDERGDRLVPITWDEHPDEVTVPHWRALVTSVLDNARRTSYDPSVTLETVLTLLEKGQVRELGGAGVSRVLTAAIATAAVDSSQFRPVWTWPHGTRLDGGDGWTLPVDKVVAEVLGMVRDGIGLDKAYAELREALSELGIDVEEPLWLDRDPLLQPERPIGSFAARQQLAARVVVVTDRAMHVFRDPQGAAVNRFLQPEAPRNATVELRKRMLTVWQGDATDQVLTVAVDDVRRARLGPAVGGLWWRLTLNCVDRTVVLRGRGDGLVEEDEVREWLGDRLERPWQEVAPAVRNVRDAVGLAGTALGALALVAGVLLTVLQPAGAPELLPPVLAVGGFLALAVAVLPDVVLELAQRGRRHRLADVVGDRVG